MGFNFKGDLSEKNYYHIDTGIVIHRHKPGRFGGKHQVAERLLRSNA
jgi:hypothetical protein